MVASLPATPLLLLGLVRGLRGAPPPPALSLQRFAACWLLAVLLFFTTAATKLPSYWLPATPAAGLLIALAAQRGAWVAWRLMVLLLAVLAAGLALAPRWLLSIDAADMPGLGPALLASGRLGWAAGCFALAALLALVLGWRRGQPGALLAMQLPLLAFVPLVLLPLAALGDRLRAEPVRQLATVVRSQEAEPLAMVGILKPSLHFYSRRVVLYEGAGSIGLLNLNDRLAQEQRDGQRPSAVAPGATLLLVIDRSTASEPHWSSLRPQRLAEAGIYELWRLDRRQLEQQARQLQRQGLRADWRDPRPERY